MTGVQTCALPICTFLHKTAVKPALKLLFEEGFEGAEDEIRNAYEEDEKVIIKMQY